MDRQSGHPLYFPTIAADKTCGLVATHAILAALFARERTGKGSYVEVPMFESMAAFNLVEHYYGHHFDPPLAATGYPRILATHRKPYRTTDGYVCMMAYTDAHWKRFFLEAGRPDAAQDPRFTTMAERTRNIAALYELAAECVASRSTAAWLDVCNRLEIPAAPVNRLEDLEHDEHLLATNFFRTIDDPRMGKVRFPAPPVRIDREALPVTMAPRLGEHTSELLREVGLDEAQPAQPSRQGGFL
jgi:crotonobetainyl-CoA:carnitine CoA-transferase CaiB-like acyl-CoA transferase